MERALRCHPDTAPVAPWTISAEAARVEGMLVVRFLLIGDLSKLRLPEAQSYSTRADGLWRTTCFEAFATAVDSRYLEFNFAPSTAWAAYRFESYRSDREDAPLPPPHFDVEEMDDRMEVRIAVDTSDLADLPAHLPWRLNMAAVVEETNGTRSYWALAHPPGAPDFHHPDCFVLELPPAVRP